MAEGRPLRRGDTLADLREHRRVEPRQFTATVLIGPEGRVFVPLPFDPDEVWGVKPVHHVNGSIGGCTVRGPVQPFGDDRGIALGPAWRRDRGIGPGDTVDVVLVPEGPQRGDLAADFAAALDANPAAGAFFDGLAQFYRRAYLTWLDGAKRRPEVRAQRIVEVVALLADGVKARPK